MRFRCNCSKWKKFGLFEILTARHYNTGSVKADSNCLLQILALSRVSIFKIPFSLSELIPNVSFLRDFANDQNFFAFSFFREQSGSALSVSKEKILEIYFQYASLMTF